MSAEASSDVLAGFAEELRRNIRLDSGAARAIETTCWHRPLQDAHRALRSLDPGDLDSYAALGPSVVAALGAEDESWPLPTLIGRTLGQLDALSTLAADEIEPSEELGVSAFQEAFREERAVAVRKLLVEATVELTQLVRGLQAWDSALTIASRAPELNGESYVEELRLEHEALLAMLEELQLGSVLQRLADELVDAIERAEHQARETVDIAASEDFGGRVRRRWSRSLGAARLQIARRKESDVYRMSAAWTAHHRGLWSRVTLLEGFLSFRVLVRDELRNGLATLEEEVVRPACDPLRRAVERLHSVKDGAEQASKDTRGDWARGAELVAEYRDTTAEAIAGALADLQRIRLGEAAEDVSERCIGACQGALGLLPERLDATELQGTDPKDWPVKPNAQLTPREWAGRAVDLERLTSARASLVGVLDAVREGIEQAQKAPEVLAYNLEAALDEMHMAAETGSSKEDPWTLVRTGIDRSADYLERIVESIEASHLRAGESIAREFDAAEIELLGRLAQEDAWTAELSDAWSDALDRAKGVGKSVRGGGRQAVALTGRIAVGAFDRARAALERARRLIGGGSSPTASDQTLRELSSVDAQANTLPFVYRRLFSPKPVDDPTLFVGREADVRAILDHWADWRSGRTNTLIVTGAYGGGMRSLMTAVAASAEADAPERWGRVVLSQRVRSEGELARLLGGALFPDDAMADLDDLAERIVGIPEGRAIHVERLEHVFERTVDGFGLVQRALEFFSRTDSKVAWFVTMPADAWRLLTTVAPTSAGLARHYTVGALDQLGLSEMLKARHHRSGLGLRFDASSVPQTALRDRNDVDAVERAFFSQFWSLTDGSAPLALLYWIRSARHEPEAEHVTMAWPEELDFGFLEGLSWDQVFALQAFAEHGTLGVEDHSRIFSTATDRSYDIIESLGNLYLIEPAGAVRRVGEQLTFTTVEHGVPYRIRPVLQSVVRRALKARHLTA